jgi:hypothetical protein
VTTRWPGCRFRGGTCVNKDHVHLLCHKCKRTIFEAGTCAFCYPENVPVDEAVPIHSPPRRGPEDIYDVVAGTIDMARRWESRDDAVLALRRMIL